ncbi:hypothetical protein N9571_07380, partial [Yoonia sp.]|nr:hypothetical protein [Yoonia sp.]
MTQTVSLSFFRFAGPLARVWALTMMGGARLPLGRTPDIGVFANHHRDIRHAPPEPLQNAGL